MAKSFFISIILTFIAFSDVYAQSNLIDLSQHNLKFSVAHVDETDLYSWTYAKNACKDKNMRLPTIDELGQIFCHADIQVKKLNVRYPQSDPKCQNSGLSRTIPNIKVRTFYWSSTAYNLGVSKYIDSLDGHQGYKDRAEKFAVRCIKP